MRWTVFCRVVDNFGDIGFAWRLAADLGRRGEDVRLAVDDASALAWMAPNGSRHVELGTWADGARADAEVWVETFGCGFPAPASVPTPRRVRINVEHLSAEAYIDRSHGRPSPQFDATGEPQPVWFFFPGFSDRSGGLIQEPGLFEQHRRFGDGRDWLRALGIERRHDERCVSLFCYSNPALSSCLDTLDDMPTLLLLTPGFAAEQAAALLGPQLQRRHLRAVRLPALSQTDFDRLLWSCDLNFVRGEDSLVRALWAAVPFVWQLYPQDDGAHAAKLEAFMACFLEGDAPLSAELSRLFAIWNGLAPASGLRSDFAKLDAEGWARQCRRFRERHAGRLDLTSALLDFVVLKR
ncbi:MAG: elongation factor P maturation arginine rhamnosyltransferase EarP [Caldimonas sp.]|nr:elongation factor P maturation arginine rhamnosyltransferase EarP [Pseudomonadota bacterium]